MAMTDYFLAPDAYFCRRGAAFVFLYLKTNRYSMADEHCAAVLRALLSRTPIDTSAPNHAEALQKLIKGGLLTTDRAAGGDLCATRFDLATEPLLEPESSPEARVSIGHVWRFIVACSTAAIRLRRRRPLHYTVWTVKERKASRICTKGVEDMDRARQLTAIFQTLRCFFPRDYLCLFDSLALLEFLAYYEIFPTWVFGIKLEPWGAHCWVQEGPIVFNGPVEDAANYTPIMTI